MKKLIFLFLLVPLALIGFGQEWTTIELFDMSGVTADSTRVISLKNNKGGVLAEIEFSTVNCDILTLEVGYGITDTYPRYPATFSGLTNPVTLSTVTFTRTYLGVESNGFVIDFSEYNANYLWFFLDDDAACTSGTINLLYTR